MIKYYFSAFRASLKKRHAKGNEAVLEKSLLPKLAILTVDSLGFGEVKINALVEKNK